MKETFAARLSRLREAAGANQADVAEATGIGRPFLSMLESGKKAPGLETLVALADFYNVPVDYLYRGSPLMKVDSPQDLAHDEEERRLLQIWRGVDQGERRRMMDDLLARLISKSNAA